MTDTLLLLVSEYGNWVIFAATLLSCFALPMPSSLMMMAGGAFAAVGDLVLWQVCSAALAGALLGDQGGYFLSRFGGGKRLWARLSTAKGSARLMTQAEQFLARRGGWAIYLSRWLFSPLGPYLNLIAGATQMRWIRFAVADLAGEITWVALYVSLGYAFGSHIEELSETLGNVIGLLTAGVMTVLLGRAFLQAQRRARR
jgi:membrane protein DedA with SNARE-associated domain